MKTQTFEIDGALEVDTTPRGVDPDEPASFGGEEEDDDELTWAQSFVDEPWDDYDPEGDDPESAADIVDFSGVELEDDSTYERWLQSGLKALVFPTLTVDGALGRRTREAIKRFQSRAHVLRGRGPRLAVDGVAGENTIKALEELTQSDAPSRHEGDPAPASPRTDAPEATAQTQQETPPPEPVSEQLYTADAEGVLVREIEQDGNTVYVISSGGDEVRFSYWTEDFRKYKPYNVSRYRGAKKGLVDDQTILDAGYSTSELGILHANAMKESGGTYGAINTWDDQLVSWGMAQFAGHAGTLAALLAALKENPRSAAAYKRWFADNGLDVEYGAYPWKDTTKKGWHVVVKDGEKVHRGDDGWSYVRTQPRLLGAFMLAGNDPAIAVGQILFWREKFLNRAIRKIIGEEKGVRSGARVMEYVTAERTLALMVRLFNWMPAYVRRWGDRFLAELAEAEPDRDIYKTSTWDQDLEDWWAERVMKERRDVKKGSYDTYALDLSRTRGSFVVGENE
ncbi:MAG: peptidoglycan-binding protein [Myxococcales bacterium]|nr:peptidoglycan-binding protein [Myxococcales bacterium]